MSETFGCAIIKIPLTERLRPQTHRNKILQSFGMKVISQEESLFNRDYDLSEDAQLTTAKLSSGLEVWFGWPVAYMIEDTFQHRLQLNKFESFLVAQEKGSSTYTHQYIKGGKLGEGAAIPTRNNSSWHRHFKQSDFPVPKCGNIHAALVEISQEIKAPFELVERCYRGMSGKGFYGIAHHANKGAWVLARSLAEKANFYATEFIELNPNSYRKKGKPFSRSDDESLSFTYLSQSDVFYEVQHRALAFDLGTRIDGSGFERLSAFSRPVVKTHIIRSS